MNVSAVYHRPESEFAYLYAKDKLRLRLRSASSDVQEVYLIHGDPYLFAQDKWYLKKTKMKRGAQTDTHDYWEIEVGAAYRRLQYGFCIKGTDGTQLFYCDQGVFPFEEAYLEIPDLYFRMPYFQEADRFKAPEWVKQTIWYQIFPERFANGDRTNDPPGARPWASKRPDREDYFGGDLKGVLDHLDYLSDLGISGIYFCPIFKAGTNHKYDTIDYFEIDPDFGDKALFRKLVEEAHKRGIRIMLDAVFNHIGAYSPQWQDVILHGEKSRYKDWFHIHSFPVDFQMTDVSETASGITYDTFSFNPQMPKLNTANPEVQDYLIRIASYWIEEFDIDAWRLDVANEVDHQFWKKFRRHIDAVKPDFYLLGEIWHSSQKWLEGDEFHAVMNYAFTDNIKEFFADKKISAKKMISGMNHQQMLYRDQTNEVAFNLLDSHDTARILTRCQGDKELARAVLAFMFLQKGTPCIFYGTEIGMAGGDDPDCRGCMIWDKEKQDMEMLAFMKKLIALRKKYSKHIAYGTAEWLQAGDENVLAFQKKFQGETLICFFNEGKMFSFEAKGDILLMQNTVPAGHGKLKTDTHGFVIMLG